MLPAVKGAKLRSGLKQADIPDDGPMILLASFLRRLDRPAQWRRHARIPRPQERPPCQAVAAGALFGLAVVAPSSRRVLSAIIRCVDPLPCLMHPIGAAILAVAGLARASSAFSIFFGFGNGILRSRAALPLAIFGPKTRLIAWLVGAPARMAQRWRALVFGLLIDAMGKPRPDCILRVSLSALLAHILCGGSRRNMIRDFARWVTKPPQAYAAYFALIQLPDCRFYVGTCDPKKPPAWVRPRRRLAELRSLKSNRDYHHDTQSSSFDRPPQSARLGTRPATSRLSTLRRPHISYRANRARSGGKSRRQE